jgi:transposase
MVERARIILGCLKGKRVQQIARDCGTRPNTVIKWRQRFVQGGLAGLRDAPRPGAKPVYGADFRNQVLAVLETSPPAGQACWDGPAVAAKLDGSVHAVWRVLRQEGICLQRQRSWCVSTDKEFAAKAANIVGLYLNPPENALVISVDEKPSIQALERATGYVETDNSKIVRGCKSTYKRHGTLNLFAALQVDTGLIQTSTTTLKRREEFLQFMDQIVAETPVDTCPNGRQLLPIENLLRDRPHPKCNLIVAEVSEQCSATNADIQPAKRRKTWNEEKIGKQGERSHEQPLLPANAKHLTCREAVRVVSPVNLQRLVLESCEFYSYHLARASFAATTLMMCFT